MAGLKYEKNPTTRNTIMVRVEGYMKRAETLSEILKSQSELGKGGTSPGGAATASSSEKDKVTLHKNAKVLHLKRILQYFLLFT